MPNDNIIDQILTAPEAAELWGLEFSTIRRACLSGRFMPHEARKENRGERGIWLVTYEGMERLYGLQPKKTGNMDKCK